MPENNRLLSLLQNEAELIAQFTALLQQEQNALRQGSIEGLASFSEQKIPLTTQLETLAAERDAWLLTQGFASGRQGLEAWLGKQTSLSAANTWQQTLALAAEARELNRLNGELIRMHMQHTAGALEILQSSERSFDLYGPDGKSSPLGTSRINDAV